MFYLLSWYSYIFLIPAILFSLYASFKVNSSFTKYSKVASKSNWTASDMSRMLVEKYNLSGVTVRRTRGKLTDNYNPKDNSLNLSESVYNSNSIAALGVAAHETGHAVQHAEGYLPFKLRGVLVPVTNIGSMAAIPLIILGVIIELLAAQSAFSHIGSVIVLIGIIGYAMAAVFALITLPVEINASRRAAVMLANSGVLEKSEISGVKKVLSSAALTYFAAFAVSLAYLLRLLWLLSYVRGNRK